MTEPDIFTAILDLSIITGLALVLLLIVAVIDDAGRYRERRADIKRRLKP